VVHSLERKTWNRETRLAPLIRAQEHTPRISLGANGKVTQTSPYVEKMIMS